MSSAAIDPRVYLLADHLDNILSCGEDLLAAPAEAARAAPEGARRLFVETLRTLEVRIVSRVLMAREQAEFLRRSDKRFAPLVSMFQSGTLDLADAAAELADSTGPDFLTGNDAIAYLRSRRVISQDAPGLADGAPLLATEVFAVAGTSSLGALMDLTSTFLDALEAHYDLYEGTAVARAPRTASAQPATASETTVPSAQVTP